MIKKCYVIESGCIYEGGGVDGVSLEYDIAIEYAKSIVLERQKENDEHYEWYIEHTNEMILNDPTLYKDLTKEEFDEYIKSNHSIWKQETEKYWSDGMNYIRVIEMDLIK